MWNGEISSDYHAIWNLLRRHCTDGHAAILTYSDPVGYHCSHSNPAIITYPTVAAAAAALSQQAVFSDMSTVAHMALCINFRIFTNDSLFPREQASADGCLLKNFYMVLNLNERRVQHRYVISRFIL